LDHGLGAEQLGGDDRVLAIHRVVAADRDQRDVERIALGDQLHVAEEAGVTGVVDGLVADVDDEAGGGSEGGAAARGGAVGRLDVAEDRVRVPGGHELDPAVVELDGSAEVRV